LCSGLIYSINPVVSGSSVLSIFVGYNEGEEIINEGIERKVLRTSGLFGGIASAVLTIVSC
jgi:hypothetical protein